LNTACELGDCILVGAIVHYAIQTEYEPKTSNNDQLDTDTTVTVDGGQRSHAAASKCGILLVLCGPTVKAASH